MIRPVQILFFSVTVFTVVIVLSLCKKEHTLAKAGSFRIKLPHFFNNDSSKKVVYKDISHIVNFGKTLDNQDDTGFGETIKRSDSVVIIDDYIDKKIKFNNVQILSRIDSETTIKTPQLTERVDNYKRVSALDSAVSKSNEIDSLVDTVRLDSLNTPNSAVATDIVSHYTGLIRSIEYPDSSDTTLYPFFRELHGLSQQKKLIHILHYGDSQIEGDRVSSYLRNQFQRKFGGVGIGMMPIVANGPASLPYSYEVSSGWVRYSAQDKIKKSENNQYGIYLSYYKLPENITNGSTSFDGWVNLKWSNTSNPLIQRFTTCKVYYANNTNPFNVELVQKDSVLNTRTIEPDTRLRSITWNFTKSEKDLYIRFKGTTSPDFYGVSLTGSSGIAFDNIPLRGSSGLEFTSAEKLFLANCIKTLNTKLLIMQFGVNIVPNVSNSYKYYEKSFSNQLRFLKTIIPDIQIVVVGVSDAAQQTENGIESYPSVEKVRNAQKAAAHENGCVFWDTFEAMGGRNSIYSWVHAEPPLAQKDYTHLTSSGAKIIGEMLFRAIIEEYAKFLVNEKV